MLGEVENIHWADGDAYAGSIEGGRAAMRELRITITLANRMLTHGESVRRMKAAAGPLCVTCGS